MGIFNKRNAVVGWSVLKLGKRAARRKSRGIGETAVAAVTSPKTAGITGGVAALAGGLLFWRKKKGGGSDESGDS